NLMSDYNNFTDVSESIFVPGFNKKIDRIVEKIARGKSTLESIKEFFSNQIVLKKKFDGEKVKLELSDKKYCFTLTKTHEKILRDSLNKLNSQSIKIDLDIGERLEIKKSDIEFK